MSPTSDFPFWPSIQGQHFLGSGHVHGSNWNAAGPGQREKSKSE